MRKGQLKEQGPSFFPALEFFFDPPSFNPPPTPPEKLFLDPPTSFFSTLSDPRQLVFDPENFFFDPHPLLFNPPSSI